MYKITTTFLLLLLLGTSFLSAQKPVFTIVSLPATNFCNLPSYKLVWNEEFDGNALDTSIWDTHWGRGLGDPLGNNTLYSRTHESTAESAKCFFKNENVSVVNGICTIKCLKENNSWFGANLEYSCGTITQRFGVPTFSRVEGRIKIDNAKGFWPAFWLFAGGSEIDIFEFIDDQIEYSVHQWIAGNSVFPRPNLPVKAYEQYTEAYHLFAVETDLHEIRFYVDNNQVFCTNRYANSTINTSNIDVPFIDKNFEHCDKCYYPANMYLASPFFQAPNTYMGIIANTQIAKSPNAFNMEIDYIRVYERNPQGGDYPDLCKVNGPTGVCTAGETIKLCYDDKIISANFNLSENMELIEDPAIEQINVDTSYIVNGVLIDTFVVKNIPVNNCIRVRFKVGYNQDFGIVSIDYPTCSSRPQLFWNGSPKPEVKIEKMDPCKQTIMLSATSDYPDDFEVQWSIYSSGTLATNPTITGSSTKNQVIISIPNQNEYQNDYFYVELKVKNKCGETTVVRKINIPNVKCITRIEAKAMPNPTTGHISIMYDTNDDLSRIQNIKIFNSFGTLIQSIAPASLQAGIVQINMSENDNGVYNLQTMTTEGLLHNHPIYILK